MKKPVLFFVIIFIILGFFVNHLVSSNLCTSKRYGFDFGSGSIKAKGVIVNHCKGEILQNLGETAEHNKFITCVIASGDAKAISADCIKKSKSAINRIESFFGINCGEDDCAGLATAWAREASNPAEVISVFSEEKIPTRILTQDLEGRLAFYSALTNTEVKKYPKEDVIIWDIGGGSFQLTMLDDNGEVYVHKGMHGIESFEHVMRSKLKVYQGDEFPFFASQNLETALKMAAETLGAELNKDPILMKKLRNPNVRVFGIGRAMKLGTAQQMGLGNHIEYTELVKVSHIYENLTPQEVIQTQLPEMPEEFVLTSQSLAIILQGIMKGGNIEAMEVIDTNFLDYLLLDQEFWKS